MEYNECKTCGANNGRAGFLISEECQNCHETRETGEVCIHAHLQRTDEEIQKTMDILNKNNSNDDQKEWFVECDFRREPKTDRFCAVCQRDLDPSKPCEYVFVDICQSGIFIHPKHKDEYDVVKCAVGPECSKKIPENFKVKD